MKDAYLKYSKVILLVLAAVLLLLVGFKFLRSFSFPDVNWNLSRKEKIKIKSRTSISQVFTASRNNLTKIRILFGKSNLKDGGEIKLDIKDENCKEILKETVFQRQNMQPDGYYDFRFSPLKDSRGKTYCLEIRFDSEKTKSKDFYVFVNNQPSPGSGYFINSATGEKNESQFIAMRPAYRNDNRWQDIRELNQRISQYKPWFFKKYYLYSVEIIFILLTITIIVVLV